MNDILKATSENLALWILALCGALVFGALTMEHAFGDVPCPLCLMQRLWFFAAGLFAFTGLMHDPRWGIYPLLSIVSAVAGGYFSLRQIYLQTLPADQVPACGAPVDHMIQSGMWSDLVTAMTQGSGDCAEVLGVLGVPYPYWALLGFVAVIFLAAAQMWAGNRR